MLAHIDGPFSSVSRKSPTEEGGPILRPTEIFICIFLYKLQQKQLCQKRINSPLLLLSAKLGNAGNPNRSEAWLTSGLSIVLPDRDAEETQQCTECIVHCISKRLLFLTILAASSNIIEVLGVLDLALGDLFSIPCSPIAFLWYPEQAIILRDSELPQQSWQCHGAWHANVYGAE